MCRPSLNLTADNEEVIGDATADVADGNDVFGVACRGGDVQYVLDGTTRCAGRAGGDGVSGQYRRWGGPPACCAGR